MLLLKTLLVLILLLKLHYPFLALWSSVMRQKSGICVPPLLCRCTDRYWERLILVVNLELDEI